MKYAACVISQCWRKAMFMAKPKSGGESFAVCRHCKQAFSDREYTFELIKKAEPVK